MSEAVTMRRICDRNEDERRNVNGVKEVESAIVKGQGWHTHREGCAVHALQTGLSVSNGRGRKEFEMIEDAKLYITFHSNMQKRKERENHTHPIIALLFYSSGTSFFSFLSLLT